MACGTPVIGSNVGGIKYTVEDGKTGFLVPPNDPDNLASRIFQLLGDTSLQKKMSSNAIRRVNALFTWNKVAEMMSSLYERILMLNTDFRDDEEQSILLIEKAFDQATETIQKTQALLSIPILKAASMATSVLRKNKKILICGNGGSAAESQHLAAELIGRFEITERPALPAISLTTDSATITAWVMMSASRKFLRGRLKHSASQETFFSASVQVDNLLMLSAR